jgi:hypothetical protein
MKIFKIVVINLLLFIILFLILDFCIYSKALRDYKIEHEIKEFLNIHFSYNLFPDERNINIHDFDCSDNGLCLTKIHPPVGLNFKNKPIVYLGVLLLMVM